MALKSAVGVDVTATGEFFVCCFAARPIPHFLKSIMLQKATAHLLSRHCIALLASQSGGEIDARQLDDFIDDGLIVTMEANAGMTRLFQSDFYKRLAAASMPTQCQVQFRKTVPQNAARPS